MEQSLPLVGEAGTELAGAIQNIASNVPYNQGTEAIRLSIDALQGLRNAIPTLSRLDPIRPAVQALNEYIRDPTEQAQTMAIQYIEQTIVPFITSRLAPEQITLLNEIAADIRENRSPLAIIAQRLVPYVNQIVQINTRPALVSSNSGVGTELAILRQDNEIMRDLITSLASLRISENRNELATQTPGVLASMIFAAFMYVARNLARRIGKV